MSMTKRAILFGVAALCLALAVPGWTVEYTSSEVRPAGDVDGYWDSVAASGDGRTLIAGHYDGRLYTSTDIGQSWVERQPAGDTNLYWSGVACSGDGAVMLAASAWDMYTSPGRLYASINGGQSWAEEQPAGDADLIWTALACSADGRTVLVGVGGGIGGRLYIQRGGPGNAWLETQPSGPTNFLWTSVACSGDGSVLMGCARSGGVYLSRNNGVSWTQVLPTGPQTELWSAVAMSAFGQHLYVAHGFDGGRLYGSSDGGQSWDELRPGGDTDIGWSGLACSGNGRGVLAVAEYGRAYASDDAGGTWDEWVPSGASNHAWQSATMSVDGRRVTAGQGPGRLYSGAITSGVSRFFYEASDSNGVSQIWTCLTDGSGELQLFDDSNNRYLVAVSADQTKLAYIMNDGALKWICTSDINGTNERKLISTDTTDAFGCVNWHPDGVHLIYTERTDNGSRNGDVFRCDTSGSNIENLTSNWTYNKHYAAYAPDGAQFCMGRNETGWYAFPQNLFVCDADGSNERILTDHGAGEDKKVNTCRYSPSGAQIVYQLGYGSNDSGIWTIRPDGHYQSNIIVAGAFRNQGPAFTRDGTQVVFTRYTGGRWQLATCDPDGSNVQVLSMSSALNRKQPCHAVVEGLASLAGRVRCDMWPPRAVVEGARWRLTEGADVEWHDSGEVSDLLAVDQNPYTVEFDYITDYCEPEDVDVTISHGVISEVDGVYMPCDMAYINGGTFQMGLYLGQGGHSVTLDDFMMDYGEVTVAEYQSYCFDTGQTMPDPPPWGWSNSSLPVVNVTWNDAAAFAAWAGKRLPTEAEFEYAMRGGAADQLYPWGDTISSESANYMGAAIGQPTVAGSFASSSYYLYDIAGNVNEWCYDWYEAPLTGPVTNPIGPASGAYKVSRSGSWVNRARQLRCSSRIYRNQSVRYIDLGFRCAAEAGQGYMEEQFAGAPDWWVFSHFGLEVGGPGGWYDPLRDSDGDGSSDEAEFAAGTSPTDATSVLSIERVVPMADGAGYVVEWASEPGRVYTLEHCEALGAGYQPVAGNIPATPPVNTYSVSGPHAAVGFYRVRIPQ